MQLVMYVGNDFIASAPVNNDQLSEPGYIGRLKRRLAESCQDWLQWADCEPEFWVVNFERPAITPLRSNTAGNSSETSDQSKI